MRYLTKSRFKLAIACPTKLNYTGKPDYANTMADNEFMAMLADGGFQVGELAKLMHPGGHEVTAKNNADALAQTAQWMQQDTVTLYEPAFAADGCLVRVDVLVKRGDVIEIIEVKAKSFDSTQPDFGSARKSISTGMLPYLQDVAFQKHVVQRAHPACTVTAALMMPDKSKVATVNGLNQWFKVQRQGRQMQVLVKPAALALTDADAVLCKISVDHLVNEILAGEIAYPGGQAMLPALAKDWAAAYAQDQRIAPSIGMHCGGCEFKASLGGPLRSGFHECWMQANHWGADDFAGGTVLDIWNFRSKQKMIDAGRKKLTSVTQDDLGIKDAADGLSNSQRQWLQIGGLPPECVDDGFYLDRDGLANEMTAWTYPYHLIDFETASVALPFHQGRRPYEQVAFQFSHHVLESDGSVRHQDEFLLAEPGVFPNYAFVRALRAALIGDHGTVMRWSHHENSILNAIKTQLLEDAAPPDDMAALIDFIDSITKGGPRAMVDLADVARRRYFHPSTHGSNSIKKVLPSVMSSSDFLKTTYGQPCYGAAKGDARSVPSCNFTDMVWWRCSEEGVSDPYKLLLPDTASADTPAVNQGGAATNAYLCLQFEDMPDAPRRATEKALLRYCELDTLAMVMILQAWQHWIRRLN